MPLGNPANFSLTRQCFSSQILFRSTKQVPKILAELVENIVICMGMKGRIAQYLLGQTALKNVPMLLH